MAHRTTATLRRPPPHRYRPDPETPGYCRCRLPRRNKLHDEDVVAAYERDQEYHRQQIAQGQAWHRARTGEHD